jgi:GTP-binding protein
VIGSGVGVSTPWDLFEGRGSVLGDAGSARAAFGARWEGEGAERKAGGVGATAGSLKEEATTNRRYFAKTNDLRRVLTLRLLDCVCARATVLVRAAVATQAAPCPKTRHTRHMVLRAAALRAGAPCSCAAILSRPPSTWRVFLASSRDGHWPLAAEQQQQQQQHQRAAAAVSPARRARAARGTAAAASACSSSSPSPTPRLPPTLDLALPPPANAKVRTAVYRGSAVRLEDCPPEDFKRPEVAVIGRSNVGKSSLINSLTASKGLAMVSKSPGKTRTINHFLVNDAWWLVDLPGYGYAKTAKTTRQAFDEFSRDFLARRRSLAMVLLLVDASVPPQRVDLEYAAWLAGSGVPFAVVFTKTDKRPKKKGSGVGGGGKGGGDAGAAAAREGAAAAAVEEEEKEEEEEEEENDHAPENEDEGEDELEDEQQPSAASPRALMPRAALASPHALAFLRALANEQGFRLLPPSMATSAATGSGTAEVLRFVSSVRLGFLQQRKRAKEEAQQRVMAELEEEDRARERDAPKQ